jgi:hypothetical protein
MNFDGTVVTASSITVNTEVNAITTSSGTVYPGEYPYDVFVMVANEDQTTATSYTFKVEAAGVTYTGPTDALNAVLMNTKYYQVYRVLEATGGSPTPPTPVVTPKNVFSVSASKKVVIAHGNLKVDNGTYSIQSPEYNRCFTSNDATWSSTPRATRDLFKWSEVCNTSSLTIDGETGYCILTKDEWVYLLNTRTGNRYAKATVANVRGLIIFPDEYTHPSGLTAIQKANTSAAAYTSNTFDATAWSAMADAGAVFLPAAGYYSSPNFSDVGNLGAYWSSSETDSSSAYCMYFYIGNVDPGLNYGKSNFFSVRPVREYTE